MMKYPVKVKLSVILFLLISLLSLGGCENQYADPIGLTAFCEGEKVILSWQATDSALNYRLSRKKESENDFKFIADVSETNYTDNTVKGGEKYQFKLQALYEKGTSNGIISDIIFIADKTENLTPYATVTPMIESVTRLDKYTAVLLLSENKGNTCYEILRSNNASTGFQAIGTTEGNAYYDKTADNGIPYYYIVRVKDNPENKTSLSRQIGYNSKKTFNVPVFMYHEFVTQKDLDAGVAFDEYAIWESEFEKDLMFLKTNGYNTITSKQLSDFLEGKGKLPEKPVILTVDDGKFGVYKHAYPLLKKHKMTMSLAVIGNRIDIATLDPVNRGGSDAPYSTWDEIGEMSKSGFVEIISHTYNLHIFNHDNRQGANAGADDTVESFLPVAQRDFSKIFTKIKECTGGMENYTLAYPYSKRSVLADTVWLKSGYKLLFGGDGSEERKTYSNYFIAEAGINRDSAVMRRITRMTGTPISEYLKTIEMHDTQ